MIRAADELLYSWPRVPRKDSGRLAEDIEWSTSPLRTRSQVGLEIVRLTLRRNTTTIVIDLVGLDPKYAP